MVDAVAVINPPEEGVVPVRVRTAPCGSKTVTPPAAAAACAFPRKKKKKKKNPFPKTAARDLRPKVVVPRKKKKKKGKEVR